MSQISNVDKIGFSTAFSMDRICAVLTDSFAGSTTVLKVGVGGGTDFYQKIIPHSFTRPVECDTLISINGGTTYDPTLALTYSDSSNLYLNVLDNTLNYTYKIVCTWIDSYDSSNPLVSPILQSTNNGVKTYFDTRYNYRKILKSNPVIFANPGSGGTSFQLIPYTNAGVYSAFKVYFESNTGQVWPIINGGAQDQWLNNTVTQYELSAEIDDIKLSLICQAGTASASSFKVWYKMYYES